MQRRNLILVVLAMHTCVFAQTAPPPAMLLCKATIQGQLFTKTLYVDYPAGQVNGNAAGSTPERITWASSDWDARTNKLVRTQHDLDRLSGAYRTYTPCANCVGPSPTYMCEKAPPAKF